MSLVLANMTENLIPVSDFSQVKARQEKYLLMLQKTTRSILY